MKNYALIGAAGYVAPRHMKAMAETGGRLLAAYDPNDSVGIMDSYFPDADFFVEFERFDRHIDKLKRQGQKIDYVSVCSPNYLHDAHIRFGLRQGADVICEKPVVLNPWNVDALMENERETGHRVYTILQLRLHPALVALKDIITRTPRAEKYDVELTYITARGKWYYASWKGDVSKSGGIATNIGIHFFDALLWLFGPVQECTVHLHTHDRAAGYLELEKARVSWFLSINADTIPVQLQPMRTFRQLTVNGEPVEFSNGFTDLHNQSYLKILAGEGFSLQETLPAVKLAHDIRNKVPNWEAQNRHYLTELAIAKHPFAE